MNVQDLIAKRARAWEAAKSFLEAHRGENGVLSAEDDATYDRMEKEITDLTKEIDRLNRQAAIEAQLNQPTSSPLSSMPSGTGEKPKKQGRASDQYAKDMLTAMRTNFHQVSDILQEGVDADGGYLVPEEWDSRLIDVLNEENIMRGLATQITTSGEHKINIAGAKPTAAWIEEGGALQFTDAKFGQKILDAHKLHVAVKVTEELLYGGTVAKTLTGTKLGTDDVLDLVYALKRPYRKKASFIMNDQTLAALRKLKDNNGSYIWQPSYQAGEPDRLLGYSVHTSAYAPELAADKPVMAFGDFSYYNIGDRGTRSMQELRELFAGNGMIGYVAKERVDGLLVLPEAVQIMKAGASA